MEAVDKAIEAGERLVEQVLDDIGHAGIAVSVRACEHLEGSSSQPVVRLVTSDKVAAKRLKKEFGSRIRDALGSDVNCEIVHLRAA